VCRCLCFDVSFERLKLIAESTGGGLLEAHRQTGCGARCGLCLPYIQVMLKTGRTLLPVMWADDFRAHGVNPGRIQQIQKSLMEARGGLVRKSVVKGAGAEKPRAQRAAAGGSRAQHSSDSPAS